MRVRGGIHASSSVRKRRKDSAIHFLTDAAAPGASVKSTLSADGEQYVQYFMYQQADFLNYYTQLPSGT